MPEPAIKTDGLTKRFGDILAVDDLDMHVEAGEVYGFLGPNGAGKSTTINLLLNYSHPTAGDARLLGHDARAESLAIRERIGILPEGAELYPRLTGREHVELAADTKGVIVDPDTILARVDLDTEDRDRRVDGYSKGMSQRLALGMALVGDPDLLILDEPSAGLDPTGMADIREIIREEAAEGTTVFFSSHILPEVEAVCDRVGILVEGRLVAEDTIENLREISGVHPTVEFSLETVPGELGLAEQEGVVAVEREGKEVTVTCRRPADKIDVISHVGRQATVSDVVATETSLEGLFEAYASGETVESASDGEEPAEVVA